MPGDDDIYRAQVTQRTPLNVALCAIWYRLWQLTGFSSSGSGGVPVTPSGGVVRTFTLTAATGNGSVAAGAKSVAFSSSSDFAGSITGAAFAASQAIGSAVDGADTIGAIAYTVSAGTLYIGKVV